MARTYRPSWTILDTRTCAARSGLAPANETDWCSLSREPVPSSTCLFPSAARVTWRDHRRSRWLLTCAGGGGGMPLEHCSTGPAVPRAERRRDRRGRCCCRHRSVLRHRPGAGETHPPPPGPACTLRRRRLAHLVAPGYRQRPTKCPYAQATLEAAASPGFAVHASRSERKERQCREL